MSEQWIEAREALELLRDKHAICGRLFAGLILSRARLFTNNGERAKNATVPREFWWAKGCEALEQDWERGDFSTYMEQRIHVCAHGVQMALSGVLAALPVEQRGAVVSGFSVVGNEQWISANHAITKIAPTALRPARDAEERLIEAAKMGFVAARAITAKAARHGFEYWHWQEREWDVPCWFWEEYTRSDASSRNFDQDMARGSGGGPLGRFMQLNGLHFLCSDLERHFGLAQSPQSRAKGGDAAPQSFEMPKNKGGRPLAPFNDALLCAVWAAIYRGDLTPKRQADVERAILEWASDNGHPLSETSAREKARRIFTAMTQEDENSTSG